MPPVPSARAAIVESLEYHLEQRPPEQIGLGCDAYHDEPIDHPMAYALYARGLVNLYRATGDERYIADTERMVWRLLALRGPGTAAWGLRFPWRGLGADHPYTITTALCAIALAEYCEHAGDRTPVDALRSTCRWLSHDVPWRLQGRGGGPWFAPGLPFLVTNVAAMTAAALVRAHPLLGDDSLLDAALACARHVVDRQQSPGFWTYGETATGPRPNSDARNTIDAVHTSYVIDGTLAASAGGEWADLRPALDDAVGRGLRFLQERFVGPGGHCVEKMVLVEPNPETGASPLLENPRLRRIDLDEHRALLLFQKESRLWGYGAALGALSRGYTAGANSLSAAAAITRRTAQVHARAATGRFAYLSDDRRVFPRHEAHLFEGMSAFALALASGTKRNVRV